jgi:hypothetical protein
MQIPLFLVPIIGGYLVTTAGYTLVFILAAVLPALAQVKPLPSKAAVGSVEA